MHTSGDGMSSHLNLSHLVSVPAPGNAVYYLVNGDGEEIVNMLSGMTLLQCLALLEPMTLPDNMQHSSCLLLAAEFRDCNLQLLRSAADRRRACRVGRLSTTQGIVQAPPRL